MKFDFFICLPGIACVVLAALPEIKSRHFTCQCSLGFRLVFLALGLAVIAASTK